MKSFTYDIPTRILFGKDIFKNHADEWKTYGTRAMLVTGRNSAKMSGALDAVLEICNKCGQSIVLFDKVTENPVSTMVDEAADLARKEKVDFVVGIGGGSPMDTAKIVSALLQRPNMKTADIADTFVDSGVPVICVPTTAGTGSEVTPFTVICVAEKNNRKLNMRTRLFPKAAWLDASFTKSLSWKIRKETLVDALCQNIEGMLTVRSTPITDAFALDSLRRMSSYKDAILTETIESDDMLESLMFSSCMSGMVISQVGISLPHVLSYNITETFHEPHGKACGLSLPIYLKLHPDKQKVKAILDALGFDSVETLGEWIASVLGPKPQATAAQLKEFLPDIMSQQVRLATFPLPLTEKDIYEFYISTVNMIES